MCHGFEENWFSVKIVWGRCDFVSKNIKRIALLFSKAVYMKNQELTGKMET